MTDTAARAVHWADFRAVLFDLDGVITPTVVVHMAAWSTLFTQFLAAEAPQVAAYTDADYHAYVDGKPRYDGVRDFLASRGLTLPEGSPGDNPDQLTICGLGNRKNDAFNAVLERDGVTAYPGSVALLDHLATVGVPLGVVSSSANAPAVLAAAGLLDRFSTIVDGAVAHDLGLPGKPAPDTFIHAGQALGADPASAVVLEDAISGVRAGAEGHFGLVIGVNRGVGADALTAAGAHLVVDDLVDLVP